MLMLHSSVGKLLASISAQTALKPVASSSRLIHLTPSINLKKIEKTEDKASKTTIVEGKYLDSDKLFSSKLVRFSDSNVSADNANSRPCAFCELEKRNIYVQHTDVLILRQFLREDGVPLPRKVTGLCKKQQRKLIVIAKHARAAGITLSLQPTLLDGSKPSVDPRKREGYLKWNHYFDDYEIMKKEFKYL